MFFCVIVPNIGVVFLALLTCILDLSFGKESVQFFSFSFIKISAIFFKIKNYFKGDKGQSERSGVCLDTIIFVCHFEK